MEVAVDFFVRTTGGAFTLTGQTADERGVAGASSPSSAPPTLSDSMELQLAILPNEITRVLFPFSDTGGRIVGGLFVSFPSSSLPAGETGEEESCCCSSLTDIRINSTP
jgi:hypothetical protein